MELPRQSSSNRIPLLNATKCTSVRKALLGAACPRCERPRTVTCIRQQTVGRSMAASPTCLLSLMRGTFLCTKINSADVGPEIMASAALDWLQVKSTLAPSIGLHRITGSSHSSARSCSTHNQWRTPVSDLMILLEYSIVLRVLRFQSPATSWERCPK